MTQSAGSSVTEDYVKVIYAHTEWQPEPITPSALAAKLGLAASTVTEMVKKLTAAGFVTHQPYGAIELSDAGRELALRMVRRHRLIETWLVEAYHYTWDEVHEEAEILEHALSDRLLEAIAAQLGQPTRDPHGDPIPSSDGTIAMPDAVRLSEAGVGASCTVVRISDDDPELLRWLETNGIRLDAVLEVVGPRPFGGALEVVLQGGPLDLGTEAAGAVFVAVDRPRS